jgi:HlyD family secretion protein
MKRYTIIASVIILVAIGIIAYGVLGLRRGVVLASEVETETIEMGNLLSVVEANGIVQSNQSTVLFWKIPGKVDTVMVEPGDQVLVGDTLASLDTMSLPSYIISAQAELLNAQNALEELKISELQRAHTRKAVDDAQNALDDARFPQALQAKALLAMAEAEKVLEEAQRNYEIIISPPPQSAIDQAYANLVLAENKVKETEDTLNRIDKLKDRATTYRNILPEELFNYIKSLLRKANKQFELGLTQDVLAYANSLARYNALLDPPDPVEVATAEAELGKTKAQLEAAELEWEKIKDGISSTEIALLEARLENAQHEWSQVKDGPNPDDITLLETQIAAFEAAIRQMKITAPFNGTVTSVRSQVNDIINTGSLAFQLDDLSSLHVDLAVSEIDINSIELGQRATITLDSILAKEYMGEVTDIDLVGTEIFGVTNFMVRVAFLDAGPAIKPGMTASVKIVVNEIEDVLLVPSQAIRALNGDTVVYRWVGESSGRGILSLDKRDDSDSSGGFRFPLFHQRKVQKQIQSVTITLGATSNTVSEVVSGDIQVGDIVVLDPP